MTRKSDFQAIEPKHFSNGQMFDENDQFIRWHQWRKRKCVWSSMNTGRFEPH